MAGAQPLAARVEDLARAGPEVALTDGSTVMSHNMTALVKGLDPEQGRTRAQRLAARVEDLARAGPEVALRDGSTVMSRLRRAHPRGGRRGRRDGAV